MLLKGTTYLYVGEGFSGEEDVRFTKNLLICCYGDVTPSFYLTA